MAQNLNRPNSGIATTTTYLEDPAEVNGDGLLDIPQNSSTAPAGRGTTQPDNSKCEGSTTAYLEDPAEVNGDGLLDIAQNSSSAPGGIEEGSIRQDQTGYAGS
jgi:hypothetical protein